MIHRSETDKRTVPAAPTCWLRENSCSCLRLEISGTEAHFFPYQQLVTASLVEQDAGDVLRLKFSDDDVEITGRNLRELHLALQEFAVKWIRAMPERYQLVAIVESGIVSSIRISSADEPHSSARK